MAEDSAHCLHCGSDNVLRRKWSAGAFIGALLLFGLPLLIPARKYHCFDCGADFTPPARAGQQARRLMYVAIFVAVLLAVIVLLW